jgi:protein-tyrosine-phosphatase/predicted ATP-grasp superfamily ATP-dependent carboligase
MRILILDGDSNAGCAIVQSLGAAGYECWLAARDLEHPGFASRYVARAAVYPDPLDDKIAFTKWLLDFHEKHHFALIIPPTECTLIPLHEIRDDPVIRGVLALPPARAVEVAFDKERVRALAASLGVPTPENLVVQRMADLSDPRIEGFLSRGAVVLKGIRSKVWNGASGSEHRVRIATSRVELDELARELLSFTTLQAQEWVPGKGVGIELLVDRGEIVLSFAHERIHELPLTGGGSSYRCSIPPPPALLADSGKLMRALGWHGVAMVEYRADAETGRYWLMEINGRFWGSLPLALFAGVDFPKALVELLLHTRRPEPARPRVGVYARNVSRDLQWTKAILKHDRSDRFLLTRPLPTSLLEWTRIFAGRETWDGARASDPGPILHDLATTVRREIKTVGRKVRRASLLQREHGISRARARTLSGKRRVLLLCYGNICRSAYAHVRLAARAAEASWELRSAGFHPVIERASPEPFQTIAARRGVDLRAHRSRLVDKADVDWSDLIVLMDQKNYDALADLDKKSLSKVVWLGALDDGGSLEIEDPYDQPISTTEKILDRMDRCLDRLAAALSL